MAVTNPEALRPFRDDRPEPRPGYDRMRAYYERSDPARMKRDRIARRKTTTTRRADR